MDPINAPTNTAITARFLDSLADAPSAGEALRRIDHCRSRIASGSIFSIQQNVTTARAAAGEILLRRFYSSEASTFPVDGTKRKTLTPWTECLFVRGRVFVGEGEHVLAQNFDDFEQMRLHKLSSVINVPLMQGTLCYATFNVFGTRARWLPEEVFGIRLLALAAARWVPPMPGLAYGLAGAKGI
ncbi:GAF domain-containing protein [Variovorax sp. J22P271]|uniref:GAF domain-containing protein n=1 Tax=Variovorax davisae TaxID=3053515 RepID=UPI002576686A|nr:GAF domain-containing protein [Variovorax sp. J22P271]MDM0033701.1 GAF domain-containing protein [Variovorax sp. J22P271]